MESSKGFTSSRTLENPYVVNEFGFVSEQCAGLYQKFMSKYRDVPSEGYYIGPPSEKEVTNLKDQNMEKSVKRKRKGRASPSQQINLTASNITQCPKNRRTHVDRNNPHHPNTYQVVLCGDASKDNPKIPKIKILIPKSNGSTKRNTGRKNIKTDKQFNPLPKKRHEVSPLSFKELLKLAERKQHEPVLVNSPEFESKRPMTQKEKTLYLAKMERIKKRREEKLLAKSNISNDNFKN